MTESPGTIVVGLIILAFGFVCGLGFMVWTISGFVEALTR